jgi:hypothetical protein
MRRIAKTAWSMLATGFLAAGLFLLFATPARAPHGGKRALGGRTIASMQEQDFDKRLLHYQLCYGVRFVAERATLERRRVCKAILVHRLDRSLGVPGAYLKAPVEFHCEDTVFTRATASEVGISVVLKPNSEFQAIDKAIESALEVTTVGESTDLFAREACEFLTSCKLAMSGPQLSLRKLGSCFTTKNLVHRKILLDELGAMVFKAKENQTKILYAELLTKAHN